MLSRDNCLNFYDSALLYDPHNLLTYSSLTMMKLSTKEGASYVAPLDEGAPTRSKTRKIAFNTWWNGMFIIRDKDRKTFTRKDIILNTANTNGGAHIDPLLNEAYASLSRFNSLGWKVFRRDIEDDFRNSPVLPSIRQITHEVLKTLKSEFPELF